MSYPIPGNEIQRLAAVQALNILDTPPHPDFDNLVLLTCDLLDVPMVALSIIDRDRQWLKAKVGIETTETDRAAAFCAHTICGDDALVVDDATLDPRFSGNPLVLATPNIKSYAGVPLSSSSGAALGTLCVLSSEPRTFLDREIKLLRRLGDLAQAMLDKHKLSHEHALTAKALTDQTRLFDRACDLAKLGAWEMSAEHDRLIWTSGMYKLHDMEPGADITLQDLLKRYISSDRIRLKDTLASSDETRSAFTFEGRMYTDKGALKWVRLVSDLEVENGKVVRRFGMKQDVTEQKELQARVQRLAQQDDLTGVLNRRGLRSCLLDWSRVHENGAFPLTFIALDLDNFKHINDNFGHPAGDACLRAVARRLKIALKNTGKIARTGGDEFSILRTGDCKQDSAEFVQSLMAAIAQPVTWGAHTFSLRASVGWSVRPAGVAFDPDDLMREAELALYQAKREGRNRCQAYTQELGLRLIEDTRVLNEANNALQEGRFELYYQPKIGLLDDKVDGFECLLRLNTTDGKVLTPAAFQAALDDPAVSKDIGDFVVEAALAQAADWQEKGVPFRSVAINLSASQCMELDFAQRLLSKIAERGLPTSAVQVEVTEGVFLSASGEAVLNACKALSEAGVKIAFDDFGTGFASLIHLRDFPVDELKIDRSFLTDLLRPDNLQIVAAMVNLGNNLSLKVVAEGVETTTQAQLLRAMGCRFAQGYLYSRPLRADAAAEFVSKPVLVKECA